MEAPPTILVKIYDAVMKVIESEKDGHYKTYDAEVQLK